MSQVEDRHGVTYFLQIWIEPNVTGIPPSYEQKHFREKENGAGYG